MLTDERSSGVSRGQQVACIERQSERRRMRAERVIGFDRLRDEIRPRRLDPVVDVRETAYFASFDGGDHWTAMPHPDGGAPKRVPSLVSGFAQLLLYRCAELGSFDDIGDTPVLNALMSPKERLAIWEKARGLWKHRTPDPARELKRMRQEWTRKSIRPD